MRLGPARQRRSAPGRQDRAGAAGDRGV